MQGKSGQALYGIRKKDEQVLYGMRELFESHGYRRFRMSKFEEYDFYAENRSFLGSENILTYTGLDGKLLALKPDVTLSIVKNTKGSYDSAERVYYNETVYRAKKGDKEYREIMQAGAEYIGEVDVYATLEVLLLAAASLRLIDENYIMDISHMGFVAGLLEETGLSAGSRKRLLDAVREKNPCGIREICAEKGVPADLTRRLGEIASLYGGLKETLPELKTLCLNREMEAAYNEIADVSRCLDECAPGGKFNIDFSIVNDMDYYNGIMFQGFIEGIPSGVLSGGRYDGLVRKFGKAAEAIGFAVYLDQLERLYAPRSEYDADVQLLYDDDDDPVKVIKAAEKLIADGEKVAVERAGKAAGESGAHGIRYRRLERV